MTFKKRIACGVAAAATLLFSLPACSSQSLDVPAPETEEVVAETVTEDTENPVWTADNLNDNERAVLKFLQERGITDKVALATLMGNIKQESKFDTRICEGGKRTGYWNCRRGGFGLIQWTTPGRYTGLGRHARQLGLDPNTLEAQLAWMVSEVEWRKVEHIFKTPNLSRDAYMKAAYRWLGWGVHGSRTQYTTLYINALHLGQ
jgi:hypothetical protein